MRQVGDLLVWVALVAILSAVVHFTPKFARYMSLESQAGQVSTASRSLALSDFSDGEPAN